MAKESVRDAAVMSSILRDMGVTEHEPRVISQMLDFAYRYTTQLLTEARAISEYAGKKLVDADDVRLAIDNERDRSMLGAVPRQLLLELAEEKNSVPLPAIRPNSRLPNDRFCLLQPNYRWKDTDALTTQANTADVEPPIAQLPQRGPAPNVVFDLQQNPLKRRATDDNNDDDYDQ